MEKILSQDFCVNDVKILYLNVIKPKDVLALWLQGRHDFPVKIWISLISVSSFRGRKVRLPVWFFLDEANMCYSYTPFSGKIVFQGLYHRQYPRIWWIYTKSYFYREINDEKTYVALIALGNIMLAL